MILIIGATGTVGREIVQQLVAHGVSVRALVRSPEKATAIAAPGVEPVLGDLQHPRSLDAALAGVTRAFLLSPLDPHQVTLQGNFIQAAQRAGQVYIVKVSGLGTALDSPVRSGRWHAQIEQQLEATGLPFTHLRPLFFMQNILHLFAPTIATQGALVASMQEGKIAMVDARDIAAVAVTALTEDGHTGKAYTVTGAEALSFREVAEKLTVATGRQVTYRDISLDTTRQRLAATGMPAWHVDVLMEFWTVLREGYAAEVTDTVEAVTGVPPRTFDQFAREHAALFRGA
jgi:uncharacterized protein YbjT (DUF2867 family)